MAPCTLNDCHPNTLIFAQFSPLKMLSPNTAMFRGTGGVSVAGVLRQKSQLPVFSRLGTATHSSMPGKERVTVNAREKRFNKCLPWEEEQIKGFSDPQVNL